MISVNTTEELLSAVESANSAKNKTVINLKNGDYEICGTIKLNGNIELLGDDNVNLYGTKRISLENAEKENGIYKINLTDVGIPDSGRFGLGPYRDYWEECDIPKPHMDDEGPSLELYFGDRKMNLSRYPETGFIKIKQAMGDTPMINNEKRWGAAEGFFIPYDKTVFDNNDVRNMLLVGYWSLDWAIQRHLVDTYDSETGTVKVKEPYHCYGYRDGDSLSGEIGGKFFALNVLSCVKNPGDWYIDRVNNEIYFIPFAGQQYVDVSVCENMFEGEAAENITIRNINVSGCRKSAFKFTNCNNIHIDSCTVHDVGAWGAILDWCSNSSVSNCIIYNTGGGGIACSGGDRNTLTSSNIVVNNNEIHDIAYWHKTYLPAIEMNGVNVIARENNIYDVPHFAIAYQGNNHIIEKNNIRNACYESNDAGAIYAGRDFSCQGTIIRYNYFRDLLGYENRGCLAIYFDDGMCTAEVYGNVVVNMPYVAVLVGGGRDFDIHDNYFLNCKIAFMMDNRLDRWKSGSSRNEKHLEEVPYRSEIWKNAYPNLYNILEDEPTVPKYNKFYNNTVVGGDGIVMNDKKLEKLLERKNNTYTPLSTDSSHIERLENWHYIKEDM